MATTPVDYSQNPKDYEWMIRPCEFYKDEYSECTCMKARFHQYFIFGESTDCSQWKRDHNTCVKWEQDKNSKSFNELVTSEVARREARLAPHFQNTVWTKRDQPPTDWNNPLPEYIEKKYEGSYLKMKAEAMKQESQGIAIAEERTLCVIS